MNYFAKSWKLRVEYEETEDTKKRVNVIYGSETTTAGDG